MALFTPSCLISDIRGSVGDQTFSRNAHGLIVKQKLTQTITNTAKQITNRGRFADAVTAWQGLTEFERKQWILAAKDYILFDSLGKEYVLPGYNFYVKSYMTLAVAGLGPPVPSFERSLQPTLNRLFLFVSGSGRNLTYFWTNGTVSPLVYFYFSKPTTLATLSYKPSLMTFYGSFDTEATIGVDLNSVYISLFGVTANSLSSMKIWAGIRYVWPISGISSQMYSFSMIANQSGDIFTT